MSQYDLPLIMDFYTYKDHIFAEVDSSQVELERIVGLPQVSSFAFTKLGLRICLEELMNEEKKKIIKKQNPDYYYKGTFKPSEFRKTWFGYRGYANDTSCYGIKKK